MSFFSNQGIQINFGEKNSPDISHINFVPAMKIQIDQNKPLPTICQYPLNAEGIEGRRPVIEA